MTLKIHFIFLFLNEFRIEVNTDCNLSEPYLRRYVALGSSSLHEIVYVLMASRGVIGFAVGMAMPAAQIYVRNE